MEPFVTILNYDGRDHLTMLRRISLPPPSRLTRLENVDNNNNIKILLQNDMQFRTTIYFSAFSILFIYLHVIYFVTWANPDTHKPRR